MIYNLINKSKSNLLPKASEVLSCYLSQENLPHWTAFFVQYKHVVNDQFSSTCFLHHTADKKATYYILRTGCFPFIKYHCSRLEKNDQMDPKQIKFQNKFFNLIKVANLGSKYLNSIYVLLKLIIVSI